MLPRKLSDECELWLTTPELSTELYALTDANRAYLSKWLPWLDKITQPAHTESFIRSQLDAYERYESLSTCIIYRKQIVGVIGFNEIDAATRTGQIGYWLGEAFQGKGLMTLSVRAIMEIGQTHFDLERVEIRCATGNRHSRAIPERLGFRQQCTIQRAEEVNGEWLDHVVYVKELSQRPSVDSNPHNPHSGPLDHRRDPRRCQS